MNCLGLKTQSLVPGSSVFTWTSVKRLTCDLQEKDFVPLFVGSLRVLVRLL